jgi:hypothetical protein
MVTYLEDSNSLQLYDSSGWTAAGGVSSGNAIINGAFEINQRGYPTGGTVASGVYTFDRWKATAADTTLTYTSAPQGQLVTINSGKSIEQVVERANLPAGTYTLSWQGTATGRIYNTGATPPSYAASPITVTLDGLENVEVELTASGGTKTCGFVQLEAGPVATPFRRNGNTLESELAACQRYYVRYTATAVDTRLGQGMQVTTTGASILLPLQTHLRTNPISVGFFNLNYTDGSVFNALISAVTIAFTSIPSVVSLNVTFPANGAQHRPGFISGVAAGGFIEINAEL